MKERFNQHHAEKREGWRISPLALVVLAMALSGCEKGTPHKNSDAAVLVKASAGEQGGYIAYEPPGPHPRGFTMEEFVARAPSNR